MVSIRWYLRCLEGDWHHCSFPVGGCQAQAIAGNPAADLAAVLAADAPGT